jgi:hypothetical protein
VLAEQRAIGQTGQTSWQRLVLDDVVGVAHGEVPYECERQTLIAALHLTVLHLHRKRGPILAKSERLNRPILRAGHGQQPGRAVRQAAKLISTPGRDHERQRLSDHLVLAISEQRSCRRVERLDQPALADGDDSVRDVIQYRLRTGLHVAQSHVQRRNRIKRTLQLLRLQEQVHERRHLGAQHIGHNRRVDEVDRATGIRNQRLPIIVTPIRGHEDDRRPAGLATLADQGGRLIPVHARHPDVHQDQRERLTQNRPERSAP